MPYKAKTLSGAQTRVRQLLKQREEYSELIGRFRRERKLLAMLAAKGPCFYNPLDAFEAENIRDRILANECRLKPDGTPIGH
jgi:hypothetical protein